MLSVVDVALMLKAVLAVDAVATILAEKAFPECVVIIW
jgi:hypothetical protein